MKNRKARPPKLGLSQIIEIYRRMHQAEPSSTIFLPMAEAYRKNGQLGEAAEILKNGLARMPSYWSARLALGLVYHEMRRFQEARQEVDLVIENCPDNILARRLSGLIYKDSGKSLEAAIEFKRVLATNSDDEQSASALKELIKGGFVDGDAVAAIGEMALGLPAQQLKEQAFEQLSSPTIDELRSGRHFMGKVTGGYGEFPGPVEKGEAESSGEETNGKLDKVAGGGGSQPGRAKTANDEPLLGDGSGLEKTIKKIEHWLDEFKRKRR